MARRFRPQQPFAVAMKILIPTTTIVKGVAKKVYSNVETSELIFGSFRTFNGTENFSNEVYTIIATGTIDTWYNPNITTDCLIYVIETGEKWRIISEPEDIEMRHQYLQFKVEKVGGKA